MELDATELTDWMVLETMEPFLDRRLDVHAARLMALIANLVRDPKQTPEPYAPAAFLVRWDPPAPVKPMGTETIKGILMALAREFPAAPPKPKKKPPRAPESDRPQ